MEPMLGPARCHDCHAPGMFWTGDRWVERRWREDGTPRYIVHACTAKMLPPGLPRVRRLYPTGVVPQTTP